MSTLHLQILWGSHYSGGDGVTIFYYKKKTIYWVREIRSLHILSNTGNSEIVCVRCLRIVYKFVERKVAVKHFVNFSERKAAVKYFFNFGFEEGGVCQCLLGQ